MSRPLSLRHDEVTAKGAAAACGIDPFTFRRLLLAGAGPAARVVHGLSVNARPGARGIYAIRRAALRAWITQPAVWPYVRPVEMRDPLLRHLMTQAQRQAPQRWWAPAELARACCVVPDMIVKWRAQGWPAGGHWIRVEGRRGLLWWDKSIAPPPPPDRRQKEHRYAAD